MTHEWRTIGECPMSECTTAKPMHHAAEFALDGDDRSTLTNSSVANQEVLQSAAFLEGLDVMSEGPLFGSLDWSGRSRVQ